MARGKIRPAPRELVEGPWALPRGWRWVPLGSLAEFWNGAAFKPSDWGDEGVPIIRIQNLNDPARAMNRTTRVVDSRLLIKAGDILVSWSASLDAYLWKRADAWLNQHIFKVVPDTGIVDRGYMFFLLKHEIENLKRTEHLHGSTMLHINRGPFLAHLVPLPPMDTQRLVVERINDLLMEIEDGEAALTRARDDLATWRKALLKAAVTGELTADWRAANPPTETGVDLLARILAERRTRWLADPRNKSKRYVEPERPDTAALHDIPEGWVWTDVGTLLEGGIQNGLYLPQTAYGQGTPIMRIDDFQPGNARPSASLRRVTVSKETEATYSLTEGDYVINRVNSPTHLAKSFLVRREHIPSVFESNMMRMRPTRLIGDEFLELYLASDIGRARLCRNAKSAVNQASVNQSDVSSTPVPLPPRQEQAAIMDVFNRLITSQVNSDLDQLSATSTSLRRSILAAAFQGALVV